MTTHVHVIAVPEEAEALGLAIGRAHMTYARHANRWQRWWGHLWANRFYSTALDPAHACAALKYVERNPVRAGLVEQPWDVPWSSARAHVLADTPHPLLTLAPPAAVLIPGDAWATWLTGDEDETMLMRLRTQTNTGWPTGSPDFITRLETDLGRRLHRQPAGRKPKLEAK